MTEHEQLTQLCERLGASPAQAATMAGQLLKRADQLVVERGVTREAALKGLLESICSTEPDGGGRIRTPVP